MTLIATAKPMEVNVASSDVSSEPTSGMESALGVDMALEVVTLPVADVDRAKSFYQSLGWRLDIDFSPREGVRSVQITPPHSQCSIQFGKGATTAQPGSAQSTFLVVQDIDAARDDLVSRGVAVSEVEEMRHPGLVVPCAREVRASRRVRALVRRAGPGKRFSMALGRSWTTPPA